MGKSKIFMYAQIAVVLLGVIMLAAAFFLPYAAANAEYGEWLSEHSDSMYAEEIGMTNGDAIGISPLEFLKFGIYGAQNSSGRDQAVWIICVVMISAMAVFTLLCVLFAALRRPVPLIIFDILLFIVLLLLNFDFEDRGIILNSKYDWGAAYYLYFIGFAITLIGAVWLLITKIKAKKKS